MKAKLFGRYGILVVCAVLVAGCAGNRQITSHSEQPPEIVDGGYQMMGEQYTNQSNIMVHPNKDKPSNESLVGLMRKLPGVRVSNDNGPNATITVTGMASSFISSTDPLFVVNGQAVGTNFSTIYSMVKPNDVISMSVLKGSDASIYGSRGANGVIVIRTK